MRVMSDRQRYILRRLIAIAGHPMLVAEALRELNGNGDAPTVADVVNWLIEHREEWHRNHQGEWVVL